MSYLDSPRLNFAGQFHADPSTIDNNRNNFNLGVPLNEDSLGPNNNYSVGWNPQGTHVFELKGCAVRSCARDGTIAANGDPVIGATVESILETFKYPAKLVDLDPDQQSVSQIWGLAVQISIPDTSNAQLPPAGFAGVMPATAFADMWTRVIGTKGGIPYFSAVFTSVLTNVIWNRPEQSQFLSALAKVSPKQLSIRFIVDSYQARATEPTFGLGRLVGTIGPYRDGEPTRFVAGRRLSSGPGPFGSPPYGPVPAVLDSNNRKLILDLGNFVPTIQPSGTTAIPADGWPIRASNFDLAFSSPADIASTNAAAPASKSVNVSISNSPGPSQILASISFSAADYLSKAGILEINLTAKQVTQIAATPIQVFDRTPGVANTGPAVSEDASGLYVDVSEPVFRLNPGETGTVTLHAFRFGQPAANLALDLAFQPQGNPDPNNYPASGMPIPKSVTTGAAGSVDLKLTAGDPSQVRKDMNIEGQVYFIGGSWMNYGNIFPLQNAPINVLVFDTYPVPERPTWADHVGPLLSYYAQVYPYMKTIIDLADRTSVIQNADAIGYALTLPVTDPHYMPVLRDLSNGKRETILRWLASSDKP